jgi:hypothetical protein
MRLLRSRREVVVWTTLLSIGLALRVIIATRRSLWFDDGATLGAIALSPGDLWTDRLRNGSFPLFFLLFQGWARLAGLSLAALRAPFVLMTLAAIPLAAALAREMAPAGRKKAAAWLAGALAAVHPSLLYLSAELRPYGLLALCGGALGWALLGAAHRPSPGRFAATGGLHWLVLNLHIGGGLFSLPLFAAALGIGWRRKLGGRWLAGCLGAALIPLALWAPMLVLYQGQVEMKHYDKFAALQPGAQFLRAIFQASVGLDSVLMSRGGTGWRLGLGWALPLLAAGVLWTARSEEKEEGAGLGRRGAIILLATAALGAPLLALAISWTVAPIVGSARYYSAGLLPLIAALGAAGAACWEREASWRWALGILFLLAFGAWAPLAAERGHKLLTQNGEGFSEVAAWIERRVPADALIVVSHDQFIRELARFYLGSEREMVFLSRDATAPEIRAALRGRLGPERDAALLLYRTKPARIEGFIRGIFGPWARDSELFQAGLSAAVWFRRRGDDEKTTKTSRESFGH